MAVIQGREGANGTTLTNRGKGGGGSGGGGGGGAVAAPGLFGATVAVDAEPLVTMAFELMQGDETITMAGSTNASGLGAAGDEGDESNAHQSGVVSTT